MATLTSKLVVSLVDQISGPARGIGSALNRLHMNANKTTNAVMGAGGGFSAGALMRNMLAIGAGYVGVREGIRGTVGAAIKFEEAFADVRKVVDGTPAQLSVLKGEILSLSKVIPTSAEGIADIVAAAGQSNIPYHELMDFSEMVAKVAVAWDTSERETSDSLAKIKTQLNMSTKQVGLYADAINHLSNNTASTAPNLVDFSKRVAAQGSMFGFTSTQTLAFGSAMISAGGETEVASTSFRNMGMALADAANAPKRAQLAFRSIGVDAQKVGKSFNKNAVGTMLDVFERIQKLPEHQRLSAAMGIFGREARALMPLINDSRELRRQLGLVATEADYAGSAFEEYMIRADTTSNVLQLLGNKLRARGIKYGESWLPTLKEFSLGVGDVIDTLDKRVGVIDQIEMSVKGLMTGFGYGGSGGLRELINDIGDLLFGEAFEGDSTQVDQRMVDLAKLSNKFRLIGGDLKEFMSVIGSGDISGAISSLGDAVSNMSGSVTVAGAIAIGLAGAGMIAMAGGIARLVASPFGQITILASGVAVLIDAAKGANSIGEFADNLTKLSAVDWASLALGGIVLGAMGRRIFKWFRSGNGGIDLDDFDNTSRKRRGRGGRSGRRGASSAKPQSPAQSNKGPWGEYVNETPKRGPFKPTGPNGSVPRKVYNTDINKRSGLEKFNFLWGALGLGVAISKQGEEMDELIAKNGGDKQKAISEYQNNTRESMGFWGAEVDWKKVFFGDGNISFKDAMAVRTGTHGRSQPSSLSDVSIIGTPPVTVATPVEIRPTGVQDVRLTNPPQRPTITNHIVVHAQAASTPDAIAQAIADKLLMTSDGAFSDGGM